MTGRRRGEANPIISLMEQQAVLSLLLPVDEEVGELGALKLDRFAADDSRVAEEMVACGIHPTERGSDYRAIRTEFDLRNSRSRRCFDRSLMKLRAR